MGETHHSLYGDKAGARQQVRYHPPVSVETPCQAKDLAFIDATSNLAIMRV
jgi:hypothetical protein